MAKKLFLLHTDATFDEVKECATWLSTKTGHATFFEEVPGGYAIAAPRRIVWTRGRWLAVTGVLSAAPFVFHLLDAYTHITTLQALGVGWIVAVLVLLLNREPWLKH